MSPCVYDVASLGVQVGATCLMHSSLLTLSTFDEINKPMEFFILFQYHAYYINTV